MTKPKSDRTLFMQVRVSAKERREFQAAARAEDLDVSQLCRRLMNDYVVLRKAAKREARS